MPEKQGLWDLVLIWLGILAPPLFGAMIYDARYGQNLTMRERGVNWLIASGMGVCGAGISGELWKLGPWTIAVIAVGCAFVGNDLVAILRAALKQWKDDPLGTFKGWWSAFWSRGQQ